MSRENQAGVEGRAGALRSHSSRPPSGSEASPPGPLAEACREDQAQEDAAPRRGN